MPTAVIFVSLNYGMKAKELIKLLERDGWRVVRQRGSHVDGILELITIPEHGNKGVSIGVYSKIRKIAGLK